MQIITQIFNINTVQNLPKRHFKRESHFFLGRGLDPTNLLDPPLRPPEF